MNNISFEIGITQIQMILITMIISVIVSFVRKGIKARKFVVYPTENEVKKIVAGGRK